MAQSEVLMTMAGVTTGIAREINNPLGAVLKGIEAVINSFDPCNGKNSDCANDSGTSIEAINRYCKKRKVLNTIENARNAGMQITDIVSDMLTFCSRSGREFADTDINRLIDETVGMTLNNFDMRRDFNLRKVKFTRIFAKGLPRISCRENEISQVLINIFKNSARAMNETADDPEIVIQTSMADDLLVIKISDNGPGIDKKIINSIFYPFFTTMKPGEVSGLGLSVAYYIIVINHQGEMEVASPPGKGAEFTIKLPLPAH